MRRETGYFYVFCGFTQSVQANVGIVFNVTCGSLLITFHYFPVTRGQILYTVDKLHYMNQERNKCQTNHPHTAAGTAQITTEGHVIEHRPGCQQGIN